MLRWFHALKPVDAKDAEITESTGRPGGHLQPPPALRQDQLCSDPTSSPELLCRTMLWPLA